MKISFKTKIGLVIWVETQNYTPERKQQLIDLGEQSKRVDSVGNTNYTLNLQPEDIVNRAQLQTS